jgi:hypothetical protein
VSSGYVYVLSNESMLGYVKVGRSIHGGAARSIALYRTGVATPFKLEFELFTPDHEWLESQAHMNLKFNRVSPDREFFRCTPSDAIEEIVGIYMESLLSRISMPSSPVPIRWPEPEPKSPEQLAADTANGKEILRQLKALFEPS